jgi:hypothetical protein
MRKEAIFWSKRMTGNEVGQRLSYQLMTSRCYLNCIVIVFK